ncbi:hypothetical protein [Paraburkholderia sp. MM5477-R1]|uniref:hypothetical protein n=1 Tax=Paraburkholderia sp. MM5477-R1 TaxID=2991062 RepID=UPI003D1CB7E3
MENRIMPALKLPVLQVAYYNDPTCSMHLLWSNPAAKSPGVLKIVPSDSLVSSS